MDIVSLCFDTDCICLELFKTLIPVYIKQYGWSCPNCAKDGTLGPVNFDGDSFAVSPAGPLASLVKTLSSYAQTSTAAKTQLCFCKQPKVGCVFESSSDCPKIETCG